MTVDRAPAQAADARTLCAATPAALDWIESIVPRAGAGRIGAYRRIAERYLRGPQPVDRMTAADTLCLFDLGVFVDLYRLRDEVAKLRDFEGTLARAIGGQRLYGMDRDRSPRDFQFELETAIRLVDAGFHISSESAGDVAVTVWGQPTLVECKRPSSERKLQVRARQALDQIEARRSSSTRELGLVSIEATLLFNGEHRHWKAPTTEVAISAATEMLRQAAEQLHPRIVPNIVGRLTIGAIVALHIPVWVAGVGWHGFRWWMLFQTRAQHVRAKLAMGALETGMRGSAELWPDFGSQTGIDLTST